MKILLKNWYTMLFKEGTEGRRHLKRYLREFRFLKQRIIRGWDETELWNLDSTISKFALPRLIEFRKRLYGYPGDLTEEEWGTIIDQMIEAFKIISSDDSLRTKEAREKVKIGLALFAKYFEALWE